MIFQVFDRALSPLEARELFEPGSIALLKERRPDGAADLLGGFQASALDVDVAAARKALEEARRGRDDLGEQPQEIMVMREMATPKTAYVLTRGEYDQRGEAVGPDTPAVFPPFPAGEPRNRLGLARWLTDPTNPLLARVTVNRLWQSLFGIGIVKSAEDLGTQSIRPGIPRAPRRPGVAVFQIPGRRGARMGYEGASQDDHAFGDLPAAEHGRCAACGRRSGETCGWRGGRGIAFRPR